MDADDMGDDIGEIHWAIGLFGGILILILLANLLAALLSSEEGVTPGQQLCDKHFDLDAKAVHPAEPSNKPYIASNSHRVIIECGE